MNETFSLILVTSLLTIGGLGLYLFKSSDYNMENEVNLSEENLSNTDNDNDDFHEDELKIKQRSIKIKTKKNRKGYGTKRRY